MHTPGPWTLLPEESDRPYIRVRGAVLGGRYKIANVLATIYDNPHPREAEETRANARLIALAPELLAEIERQIDYNYNPFEPDNQSNGYKRLVALRDKARADTKREPESDPK